ncbi:MAG: DNA-binding response regulator [Desulfuromonas sp.]|nr:MAG: DNA-binding response regulator [Desulfuromonas sp.]
MTEKKRVMIVDDHPVFREGLKSLVDRSVRYAVVGEASSGEEALRKIEALQPDLVTMDISLPEMSGVETVRLLTERFSSVQALMLSMHQKYEYIADSFRAGARGYVVKDAAGGRLIDALDALCRGEYYLDGKAQQEVVQQLILADGQDVVVHDEHYGLLSPREQQVMRMVVEGSTTREIAESLSLSPKTVENHRANLMKKLGVRSKMELVRYAARLGLIDVEQWKE